MPVVTRDTAESVRTDEHAAFGISTTWGLADAAGLTQFGAHYETLEPGAVSSLRHWHSAEDEFLYMLEGEAVLYEGEERHVLTPGMAAGWPAGAEKGHFLRNESAADASYLIVGTRVPGDVVTYPAHDRVLHRGEPPRFTTLAGEDAEMGPYERVARGLDTVEGG